MKLLVDVTCNLLWPNIVNKRPIKEADKTLARLTVVPSTGMIASESQPKNEVEPEKIFMTGAALHLKHPGGEGRSAIENA